MAPLMKKIAKHIDTAMEDFCKHIATHFDLDATEISSLWKESQSSGSNAAKKKGNAKKSGYVMFGLEVRPLIKAENEVITFAEMSKEVGRRWSALSVEEKLRYKDQGIAASANASLPAVATVPAPAPPVAEEEEDLDATQMDHDHEPEDIPAAVATAAPVPGKKKKTKSAAAPVAAVAAAAPSVLEVQVQDQYTALSIKDLKALCKTKGVKTSGKRDELLLRLRSSAAPVAAAPATSSDTDDENDDSFSDGNGTPGSVILPDLMDEVSLEEMEEEDAEPEPIAPKEMHKKDAATAAAANDFPSTPAASAAPSSMKKSRFARLNDQELMSQCDQYDIDLEGDESREDIIVRLEQYLA